EVAGGKPWEEGRTEKWGGVVMSMRTFAAALGLATLLGLSLALVSGQVRSASACTQVNGHLLDEHVEGAQSVGRMVGSINGRYEFTQGPAAGADHNATVLFGTGEARIITNRDRKSGG